MAMHGHSEACCTIPPIVSKGYKPTGKYKTIGGLKTYVTGPPNASKALLHVYDIFGYFPQTLQGADILATAGEKHQYQVFMPDWFEGKPADISWYPPDTKEKEEKLDHFFKTTGAPGKTAEKIPGFLKEIEKMYEGIKHWGVIGFCWGGYIVSLTTSNNETPFKVAAECHPAGVNPEDAKSIKIPLVMLASKDEDAEAVKKFEANLTKDKYVEIFSDQIHGWMAARGDLDNPRVKEEYERGYKTVLEFFAKHY